MTQQVQQIDVKLIDPDPENPRKHYPKESIAELAASFRALGVQQPLKVRPHGKRFRVVFGHRRLMGAQLAEMETVPCFVEQLSDKEAAEKQMVENLQREALAPLEVAAGYKRLIEQGYTVEELGERFGKKRSSIYAQTRLLEAGPEVRRALGEERLTASAALLIMEKVPKVRHAEAVDRIAGEHDAPMSFRDAKEEIEAEFALDLSEAPFDTTDAELVAKCPPCAQCPSRIDEGKRSFCGASTCWDGKAAAAREKVLAKAKAEGRTVLGEKESAEALHGKGYVDLKTRSVNDSKQRSYGEILKGSELETVVAVDDDGNVHELVKQPEVREVLKEKKLAAANDYAVGGGRTERVDDSSYKAEEAKRKAAVAKRRAVAESALTVVGAHAHTAAGDETWLRALVGALLRVQNAEPLKALARYRGVELKGTYPDGGAELAKLAADMKPAELRALALQSALCPALQPFSYGSGQPDELVGVAKLYKLDLEKLGKQVSAVQKAEKKAKARAKPAKPAKRVPHKKVTKKVAAILRASKKGAKKKRAA